MLLLSCKHILHYFDHIRKRFFVLLLTKRRDSVSAAEWPAAADGWVVVGGWEREKTGSWGWLPVCNFLINLVCVSAYSEKTAKELHFYELVFDLYCRVRRRSDSQAVRLFQKDLYVDCHSGGGTSDMALISADLGVTDKVVIELQIIRLLVVISIFPQIIALTVNLIP